MVFKSSQSTILFSLVSLIILAGAGLAERADLSNDVGVDVDSILYYKIDLATTAGMIFGFANIVPILFINVYRWKDWWASLLPIASLLLALAFAIRIPLKNEPSSVLLFCLQDNLFTLTPALVNIFLYLHFAKLGRVISEDYRLAERNQSFAWKCSPDTLAVSLIISDTVFYLSQAIGSAFQVERQNWSQKLCLGGILLQLITFVFFMAICIRAHLIVKKRRSEMLSSVPLESLSANKSESIGYPPITKSFITFYWSGAWMIARSLIRIVWISQTPHWRGGLARSGSLGPIIDILPVNQALVIFIVWWPSALYPISKKLLASQVWTPFFDHANKSLIPACLRRKK